MLHYEIYINKLGSFKIKEWKLKFALPASEIMYNRPGIHERNKEYFEMLNERLKNIDSLLKERKEKFNEFIRENPRNIQESKTNNGGFEEPTDN